MLSELVFRVLAPPNSQKGVGTGVRASGGLGVIAEHEAIAMHLQQALLNVI